MTTPETSRLPSLDDPYPLSAEQCAAYRRNGYILLPAVASAAEVQAYRPLIQDAVRTTFAQRDQQGRKESYGRYFMQVTNVWRLQEELQRFIFARRFAGIAAALMGVPGVRLYHDQALFKPGGGKPTPWHQDQFYWPLDTTHTVTLWMPLVETPLEMGTMSFAGGSHLEGPLVDRAISDASHQDFDALIARRGFPVSSYPLKAGDATFHSGWTVHNAHGNSTDRMREVITIIYFADGTRLMEPDSDYRRVDMEVFHPGQRPGEVAASPLNPLLFP